MTLADDEAMLKELADELADAIDTAIERWVPQVVADRCAQGGAAPPTEEAQAACVGATRDAVMPAVRSALAADVDAGGRSPLAAVRAGIGPITELLRSAGAATPPRDEFVAQAFPDDRYNIGPASFAEIDATLQDPGVAWGAARAHVHLRRRREAARD